MGIPLLAALLAGSGLIGGGLSYKYGGKEGLLGSPGKTQAVPRFTPGQEGALGDILGGARGQLPGAFDFLGGILDQSPEAMSKFEAPYMRQFQEQTIPTLAERFAGLNALGSSGFQQSLGQAGAGLSENLAALRGQLGFQALPQLQNLFQLGLTPMTQYMQTSPSPGFLQTFLGSLIPSLGGKALGGGS